MIQTEHFLKVEVTSTVELRRWLDTHHQQHDSVWLVTYKKSVAEKYISTSDVLDELLCFGWIDGLRRKLDDERTMQLISPRRVDHWAQGYKDRAARLIREGKMAEAGFRSIERAKEAGLWDIMTEVDHLQVPEDLTHALSKYDGAEAFFHAINPSSKRFVLRWVKLAKTDKTRRSRIEQIAQAAAKRE